MFYNRSLDLLLMVYVDDFKMSGPKQNLKKGWDAIRKDLKLEDPKPVGKCLGCMHVVKDVKRDGRPTRWSRVAL